MEEFGLGPNGGLLYCMEHINENMDWLIEKIKQKTDGQLRYLIFDCPGQVELYMHSDVMNKITAALEKQLHARLTCVHLIDSAMCLDLTRYFSCLLTALSAAMHLEMPHVNVLTKVDLMKDFAADLDFPLEYRLFE